MKVKVIRAYSKKGKFKFFAITSKENAVMLKKIGKEYRLIDKNNQEIENPDFIYIGNKKAISEWLSYFQL
jgi:hypothetical protein